MAHFTSTPKPPFTSFKLLCFDIMGTLIDEKAGIINAIKLLPLGKHLGPGFDEDALYASYELAEKPPMKRTPRPRYQEVLSEAYRTLATDKGQTNIRDEDCEVFAEAIANWSAFDDTIGALKTLQQTLGYKLVTLTNMDLSTFTSLSTTGALKDITFDKVLTSDIVGGFKPDPQNFEKMLNIVKEEFGVEKSEVLMVAQGLKSDHGACQPLGVRSCWIDRYCAGLDGVPEGVVFDWRVKKLQDLVELIEVEK